jgi:hypothetical protein
LVTVACPHYYCNFSQIPLRNEKNAIDRWNTRAAPVQPEAVEPVAWQYRYRLSSDWRNISAADIEPWRSAYRNELICGDLVLRPLYTAPPLAPDERMRRALEAAKKLANNFTDCSTDEIYDARRLINEALSGAADASNASAEAIHLWRHKKRGTTYTVIGQAQVRCSDADGLTDYELVTVYRGADGELWVRRKREFEDRFEALSPAGADKGKESEGGLTHIGHLKPHEYYGYGHDPADERRHPKPT